MRVAVVTGSRAEYGLLYWLLQELSSDPEFQLQLCVTGAHLSPEFGLTVHEIERDGIPIAERVEMLVSSDTRVGMAKSVGLATIAFADCFTRLRPDLVLVLGDRFEIFAAVQTAALCHIPVGHIHGGELTEGAIDDQLRHAITKLSHLHFAAAEPYRHRIIQLGEDPQRVFTVGALGVDGAVRCPEIAWAELSMNHGELRRPFFLATYHPETATDTDPAAALQTLFDVLDGMPEFSVVFTKSNADPGGRLAGHLIDGYAAARPGRVLSYSSLGRALYLNLMRNAELVIGNSSSGIIEAPALAVATVNIGRRQKGRLFASSIVSCQETKAAIAAAIQQALAIPKEVLHQRQALPYGAGGAVERIIAQLKTVEAKKLLLKRFYDLPTGSGTPMPSVS